MEPPERFQDGVEKEKDKDCLGVGMDQDIPPPEPGAVRRARPVGTPFCFRDAVKEEDPQGTQRQEKELETQQRPDGDGSRERSHQEKPARHKDAENVHDPLPGHGIPPFTTG